VAKAAAPFDSWCREVAPSTELRRWYGHDPGRFDQFVQRYRAELALPDQATALCGLQQLARKDLLTLMTATADVELSHAQVLAGFLSRES
jgi:uncharacterized protein YeaO (DUF488 family)